ncbi:phytoene desaturase family protein, partial [Streptomyces solincola]
MPSMLDAVVVGAGPNGLTAAAELARRGFSTAVFEARDTVGGGARTEELTLPGFRHDPCSAVHPLGIASPAFNAMPLDRYGLTWLQPELPMAHPFDDGTAAVLARSVAETAASFGPRDAGTYRRLVEPFTGTWDTLVRDFMSLPLTALPRDPVTLARFGIAGLPPYTWLMRRFRDDRARALIGGLVAHVMAPFHGPATSAIGLVFALAAHASGWPMPRGGSQSISDALTGYLRDLGGEVHTSYEVKRLDDLPPARAYVFDTSPTALARIAGLGRHYDGFRYGAAAFKIDYALDGPVPWTAEPPRRAGTVQIGPTSRDIATALRQASSGDTAPLSLIHISAP